jgi:hypothetical protein
MKRLRTDEKTLEPQDVIFNMLSRQGFSESR